MVSNFYRWKETYQYVYIMRPYNPFTDFIKCIGDLETHLKSKNVTATAQTNQYLNKPSNLQTNTWLCW